MALFVLPVAVHGVASASPDASGDAAAETAPERPPAPLVERWNETFRAWVEDAEVLPETQGLLIAAGRRDDDAAADLSGLAGALVDARADVADAAERLTGARELHAAAERAVDRAEAALQRAEAAVDAQRLNMDGHAASIYKYGATQLGAIETILRSGSPTDYLAHLKLRESVLSYDHHRYLELVAARDVAAGELAASRKRLDVAGTRVERREEELDEVEQVAAAVDDALTVQRRTVAAAAAAHRASASSVTRLDAALRARGAEMVRLEERLGGSAAGVRGTLRDRRQQERERLAARRAESFPFLDRTRFRRPLHFPSPTGFTCAVGEGRFVNDWAFPRPGGRTHQGTDIFAPIGTPVVAVADGEVVDIDREDRFDGGIRGDIGGRTVSIATAENERWYYAHLDVIDPGLSVGDAVEAGQPIATVGDSGNARGGPPHLHIGRNVDGLAVNPWPAMHIACNHPR